MVLYFSATGNSKHAADRIAAALGEKARSILPLLSRGRIVLELAEGEPLIIVGPTYAWGLALPMRQFLARVQIEAADAHPYVCYVATYGTSPGYSGRQADGFLRKASGLGLSAMFSVRMPDTWTPTYDLSDRKAVAEINKRAEIEIAKVSAAIERREVRRHMRRAMPYVAAIIGEPIYQHMRQTKYLHADDACIGCGLCAKRCPVRAIEMHDGRPVWSAERCAMCLSCLHRCPKFAIQYGERTQHHGQYVHP